MRWGWAAMALSVCACGGTASGVADAGGSDAGLTDAGQSDAGLPDAGAADDCTGIVPSVPASASTFDVGASAGQTCTVSLTDGNGVMAAENHPAGAPSASSQVSWHEFDVRGISAGAFTGGFSLAPQAAGFLGIQLSASSVNVALWDGSGNTKNLVPYSSSTAAVTVAAGFPSGLVVLQSGGSGILVKSFDSGGNPLSSVTVAAAGNETVLAAAQDQTGPVLAVLSSGQGVWVDLAAGTSSARFSLGSGSTAAARALIGGGVAVRLDGHWTAIVNPTNAILLPPRAWMTDGSDFVIARGNAYAVTSGTNVITLAVGQTTCGSIAMPGVTSASVGIEGTIIGSLGTGGCSKVFWSKLLQPLALQ